MRWYQLLLDIWRKENRGIWQTVILSSFHVDFMYMVYLFFQSDGTCPGLCLMHPITLHSSHLIRYCAQSFSRVWPFVTPWTIACQVPLSMRLTWQEYWNGLPFPPPGIFLQASSWPRDRIWVSVSPAWAGGFFTTMSTGKPLCLTEVKWSRSVVSHSLRPHGL